MTQCMLSARPSCIAVEPILDDVQDTIDETVAIMLVVCVALRRSFLRSFDFCCSGP
jgi:uncharacterized membrane protein